MFLSDGRPVPIWPLSRGAVHRQVSLVIVAVELQQYRSKVQATLATRRSGAALIAIIRKYIEQQQTARLTATARARCRVERALPSPNDGAFASIPVKILIAPLARSQVHLGEFRLPRRRASVRWHPEQIRMGKQKQHEKRHSNADLCPADLGQSELISSAENGGKRNI